MNKSALKLWLLIVLVTVTAFAAEAAPDMLPAAVGNKWEYETVKLLRATLSMDGRDIAVMKDSSSGTSVYEFVSVDDKLTPPMWGYTETTRLQSTGGGESETDTSEITLTSDDAALRIHSITSSGSRSDSEDRQTYDPPLFYFDKKSSVGKSWDVGTMRSRDVNSTTRARVVGTETVTVPAGTFKDCTKVVYSSDEFTGTMEVMKKTFNMTSGRSRSVYWVADGVGIVKGLEISVSSAESSAGNDKMVKMQAAVCSVSELKPGYKVKDSTVGGQQPTAKGAK